jgi:hypothetical protein
MAQLVVEVIERGIAQTEQKLNKLGQTAEKTSAATDGLGQTAEKTSKSTDGLGQTADKTSKSTNKLGQTAEKASAAIDKLGQTAGKTSSTTDKLGQTAGKTSAATDGLGKSANSSRAIMQQFGYQLQDVIVTTRDAASGLNAIGVQGGQFLSMITPLGGTLLTIAGIAGGALLGSLSKSTDQTISLSDAMTILDDQFGETEDGAIRLSDSLTKLANKNERLARTELTRSLLAASDALDEIREQSNEIIDNNIGVWFSDGADTARQLAYQIEGIDSAGQDLYTVIAQLQEANAFSPLASAAEDLQEKLGITRLESVELLRALVLVAKNPTPEAFERVGVTLEELNKQSGFSNKALLQLAEKFSELQLKATTATERLKFAKEAITNFGQAVKNANDDIGADEARREAEREQRRRESAARRAAIEAEQEARRRALLEASAQKTLQDVERLGATESQILGYWYEDNLAKLDGYLAEGLITRQEYARAQEQLLNESVDRQLAIDERLDEQRQRRAARAAKMARPGADATGYGQISSDRDQQLAELEEMRRAGELESLAAYEAAKYGIEQDAQRKLAELRQRGVEETVAAEEARRNALATSASQVGGLLGDITSSMRESGKDQTAAYKILFAAQKAAAIPSIIAATETGSAQALALGPIAGPIAAGAIKALGYASLGIVAGQAIAGFANGGPVRGPGTGRSDSIPAMLSNGEYVINAAATQRNRGALDAINSGGTVGGTMVNVTVIDRSTNGGNSVSVRQLTERDVEIMIEDRVPDIMAREQSDPYSRFSKAQRASTTTGRRF